MGSTDNSVTIWDSATGELLVTLSDAAWVGGKDSLRRIYFHPDGKQIAVVAYSAVTIWDVGKGNQIRSFKGHSDAVFNASFSPDGTRIVTSSNDKTAIIWDVTSGRAVMTLRGHSDAIGAVAYSPDGTRIATASRDQTAIIWDAVSGQALTTLRGHSNWIWGVAFSSSGKELVTASKDRTAIVWDVTTGQMVTTLRGQPEDVLGAFFSPDESYVITITLNDVVRLHPLKTQDLLALAACRASRGLNEEEIRRFNVSLPLAFNFAQRTCPPRLSWLQ